MSALPVTIAPRRLIISAIACALMISPAIVLGDTSGDEASRTASQRDQSTSAAPQALSKKESILLPESAFVVVDPNAVPRKLAAPMRPEARTAAMDISVIPQTRTRNRPTTDQAVQTPTLQSATTLQTTPDNRIELKRREKKHSEHSENQVNENSGLITAAPKPIVPTPEVSPSSPSPNFSKQVEIVPAKPLQQPVQHVTHIHAQLPRSAEKVTSPKSTNTIHRSPRLNPHADKETDSLASPSTVTTIKSTDDFVDAKKSLMESTDRLRRVEKDIDDIQNLLASKAQLQDRVPVVAALPYASVNADNKHDVQPIFSALELTTSAQANQALDSSATHSDNSVRSNKKNETLGQWGLFQLILASAMAGIVGFVLLDRSRIRD